MRCRPFSTASVLFLTALGACQATSGGTPSPTSAWNSRLIEPVTQPTIFESPVIDTQVRPMVLFHEIPDDAGGGSLDVFAVQARYAFDDRWAFIATKDGYVKTDPESGSGESGMADIAAGVKYAWIDDPERGLLVTPGFVFELASGDEDVLQGNGDGLLRPFVALGYDQGEWNTLGALGFNLPLDTDAESTSFDWHAQLSYDLNDKLQPLIEINGITWVDSGNALAADLEGGDLINLGANDAEGTVVSAALGARVRLNAAFGLGLAYEVPISSREDLLDNRITFDLIWRP